MFSSGDFSAVDNNHRNGIRETKDMNKRKICADSFCLLNIRSSFFEAFYVQHRDYHGYNQQDDSACRSQTEVEIFERFFVNIVDNCRSRLHRTAFCHYIDFREDFQRRDRTHCCYKCYRRPEIRYCNF